MTAFHGPVCHHCGLTDYEDERFCSFSIPTPIVSVFNAPFYCTFCLCKQISEDLIKITIKSMRWNLEEMCVHVDKIERRFQINETHIDGALQWTHFAKGRQFGRLLYRNIADYSIPSRIVFPNEDRRVIFFCNRMAWHWAETLVEIRGTLADIRGHLLYPMLFYGTRGQARRW